MKIEYTTVDELSLSGYYGLVTNLPDQYSCGRAALGFDEVSYGVGGIQLLKLTDVTAGQIGYSVDSQGVSSIGHDPGDWRADWIVIGSETACGDPIFLSDKPPHAVFTAMHGEGTWIPKLVAPSLQRFWDCLELFRRFARHRSNPVELEANPPGDQEIEEYLREMHRFCDGNEDAVDFWAVQAEIGMNAEES